MENKSIPTSLYINRDVPIHVYVRLNMSLSMSAWLCMRVRSVCLSIYLSVPLSLSGTSYVSVYLAVYLALSVCLSLSPFSVQWGWVCLALRIMSSVTSELPGGDG